MGTETMWEREALDAAPANGTAVPLRRVIGPSPATGRYRRLAASAIAGIGWIVAGAMVFGGGYLLWHLLFGDSVGGDVWLGQPPALAEQAAGSDDDLPGGVPWSPDMLDRTTVPGGGTVALEVELADSPTSTTATTVPATAATVTTVAKAPVVQAPAGGASATTVKPAASATTVKPTPTTVATTTATTVANTVTSTTTAATSTTVPSAVTTTTIDEPTTTDVTSTTIDDGGGSGRGRGSGGGGGD